MPRHPLYLAIAASLTSLPTLADHMEELVVTATHSTRTIDVTNALVISPDVAELLKEAPGANVNSNGPLTGIPQYRGMYGSRIATAIDGNQLAPSGPNWMDPPISYVVGSQLESLEVYRGIVPVSVAQESIGGAIDARIDKGAFSDSSDFGATGRAMSSAQSVNGGYSVNSNLYASNDQHRLKLAALTESGNNADFPDGKILPTKYERDRYDVGYGFRSGSHTFQLDYGYNDTGDTGTPALPMDIRYIHGDLYNFGYQVEAGPDTTIELALYGSELRHSMDNYKLRQPPASAADWRRNTAKSDNLGFRLEGTLRDDGGMWTLGTDGFDSTHDSDIDNPNNAMFFVRNFNSAEREVLGAFVERQQSLGANWTAEFGARYNRVDMDAGKVDGTPAMMMPPAQMLRDEFNNAQRSQTDNNVDLVAKAWFAASDSSSWYLGVARKNRSPSYQERYLWLPLEATAGLADGNTYTGTIALDPETSNQVEFGLDFSGERLTLSPRIFYNKVDDYIQGTPSESAAAVMFVNMMSGGKAPPPLQFNNVDAKLYGFDMDWSLQLDDHWALSGLLNYVRGERDDINDNLYRIAPPNASFRLGYAEATWSASVEGVVYDQQNNVSATNSEQKTSGYGLVNLKATWQATQGLQLAAGVDNLFDREYRDHLNGYNRAANPDIALRERLPGYGINAFARVMYTF
ncbi:MAG: TonB-dependent receptor [Pseudomonadales bacterium]|nr:TonB-dependent receptor [Halioglobus sp.]MCP5130458.1 TonB-dependent receptor [Pseudomonadales bacterium]